MTEIPPGPALPVVLVHGIRTSSTMWRAQQRALEAAGRTVRAVDLPGHGARLGEPFTVAGCEQAVVEAIDDVGGEALLVGLSLGGYLSIEVAARNPDKVRGLVAAGCCTDPRVPLRAAWTHLARWIERTPGSGAGLNAFMVRAALSPQAQTDIAAGGFALRVMSEALEAVGVLDPISALERSACPVWVVNGALDHFRTQERSYVRAARRSGQPVRHVVVPRARHLVSLDAPVAFSRVLLEALEVVDPQSVLAEQVPRPGAADQRR